MIKLFKEIVLHIRIKRAIRLAHELAKVSKRRYIVLMVGGIPKVYSKQELKSMISQRKFSRGVTIQQLESRAILITA